MPPDVRKLAQSLLTDPLSIAVTPVSSTVDLTAQSVYLTDKDKKTDLLVQLMMNDKSIRSSLIFTRTKYGADRLCKKLNQAGIKTMSIHGDKTQGQRQNALAKFKEGAVCALVATDIAARGIDIEDLSHVINFEIPNEPETYVHRIGRTGRAGKTGIAISLCDFDETEYLADIEKLIKKKIPVCESNPYPMTVFIKSPPKVRQPRPKKV
ncbi:atp-dependent rna helicase rhle-related [Holotrichia oblita]|nr:atp-dependent rna helicase rhle-related [Holotrichia oblita]